MKLSDKLISESTVFSTMADGIIICTPKNKYIKLDRAEYIEPKVETEETKPTHIYCCTRLEFHPSPNKYLLGSNPRTEYIEATDKREARKKIKAMFPTEKKFSIMYYCHPNMFYSN